MRDREEMECSDVEIAHIWAAGEHGMRSEVELFDAIRCGRASSKVMQFAATLRPTDIELVPKHVTEQPARPVRKTMVLRSEGLPQL